VGLRDAKLLEHLIRSLRDHEDEAWPHSKIILPGTAVDFEPDESWELKISTIIGKLFRGRDLDLIKTYARESLSLQFSRQPFRDDEVTNGFQKLVSHPSIELVVEPSSHLLSGASVDDCIIAQAPGHVGLDRIVFHASVVVIDHCAVSKTGLNSYRL
jgi:hypothetical protein